MKWIEIKNRATLINVDDISLIKTFDFNNEEPCYALYLYHRFDSDSCNILYFYDKERRNTEWFRIKEFLLEKITMHLIIEEDEKEEEIQKISRK